jgi:hypothetical protein
MRHIAWNELTDISHVLTATIITLMMVIMNVLTLLPETWF